MIIFSLLASGLVLADSLNRSPTWVGIVPGELFESNRDLEKASDNLCNPIHNQKSAENQKQIDELHKELSIRENLWLSSGKKDFYLDERAGDPIAKEIAAKIKEKKITTGVAIDNDRARCLKKSFEEKQKRISLEVFSTPNRKSKSIGRLEFYLNGMRFARANFIAATGERIPFEMDYQDDDKQGSELHTVLATEGNWVLLPKGPFSEPVWVEFKGKPSFRPVSGLVSIETKTYSGKVFVDRIKDGFILGHVEHPSDTDGWCEDPASGSERKKWPPIQKLKIPVRELFDDRGHIKAKPSYERGC